VSSWRESVLVLLSFHLNYRGISLDLEWLDQLVLHQLRFFLISIWVMLSMALTKNNWNNWEYLEFSVLRSSHQLIICDSQSKRNLHLFAQTVGKSHYVELWFYCRNHTLSYSLNIQNFKSLTFPCLTMGIKISQKCLIHVLILLKMQKKIIRRFWCIVEVRTASFTNTSFKQFTVFHSQTFSTNKILKISFTLRWC
jgi:hypothetical protein